MPSASFKEVVRTRRGSLWCRLKFDRMPRPRTDDARGPPDPVRPRFRQCCWVIGAVALFVVGSVFLGGVYRRMTLKPETPAPTDPEVVAIVGRIKEIERRQPSRRDGPSSRTLVTLRSSLEDAIEQAMDMDHALPWSLHHRSFGEALANVCRRSSDRVRGWIERDRRAQPKYWDWAQGRGLETGRSRYSPAKV